ncbi:MAG: radical SAM protein [Elusimicrobiota bacterium]
MLIAMSGKIGELRNKKMLNNFRLFNFGQVAFVCRIAFKGAWVKNLRRLVKSLINLILRPDSPAALIIGVTYKCQYRCHYCSTGEYPSDGPVLGTEEIKDAVDQASALKISKVNFFGGEPLLREDITELVGHASSRDLFVFLDTNGELLTPDSLKRLKSAGITAVCVNTQTKDSCGESDTLDAAAVYRKIEIVARDCKAAGVPCMFSVYVDNRVLNGDILENIILLSRRCGASGVRLLLPIDCGRLKGRRPAISAFDLKRVHSLIDNYFVYSESMLYGISGGAKVCEAKLKKTVYLSPYGDVQFCYTVPFCFGNIRKEKLGAIIGRMYSHELFRLAPGNKCPMNDAGFKEALRDPRYSSCD